MHEAHSNFGCPMFKLEKYVRDYPWLYFNVIDAGYTCKICEIFPPLFLSTGGNARLKFTNEAVKSLTDHPQRFLDDHQNSFKHNATKQYRGIISFHSR